MSTPDDLYTDAIQELELDQLYNEHQAGEHQEEPRVSSCAMCERDFLDAAVEHAWMGRAVKVESESFDLARQDLDMRHASERELMHAIQARLK